ncbi:MAG: enoyl-CoA hydratase/isomerase family protein [Kiloniellales bacterium]
MSTTTSTARSDLILLERSDAIARVTLNRPERLNAFNLAMWERLGVVMAEVNKDDSLRCVLLSGAGGKAFGAGADIAEFSTVRSNAVQAQAYGQVVDRALEGIEHSPHAVVVAIQGPCMGGGLELALLADLRICGEGAKFGIPIKRIGHCLPYSGLHALVELTGRATALEILLEGRVFGAAEALAKGLVTRVVADDQVMAEAEATAGRIASGAPLAMRWHKRFVQRVLDPRPLSEAELAEPFKACDSEDYKEGIRAFLAKEIPLFRGR